MNGGTCSPKIGRGQVTGQCCRGPLQKAGAPIFIVHVENGSCHGSICGWDLSMCLLLDDTDYPVEDDVAKVVVDDCT